MLVEKTVSRIAQDMLLEHGITLVINVKPVSIMMLRVVVCGSGCPEANLCVLFFINTT